MSKKVKMLVYGEPGVGKSVFASQFPKPFFITTDGNYEWLEEFGAKPDAHKRVDGWSEFVEFISKTDFKDYDTIVIDLLEDLFKWNEYEYIKLNKLEHVGDTGYGKGYDITRNSFFMEVIRLLNFDKHVVLLMHETVITLKDRRGVERHVFKPSSRLPEKVLDMIEGRIRFLLRAYFQDVEIEGRLVQKRMLSLIPKSNEYGIIRGVNTNVLPEDISLSVKEFFNTIEINSIKLDDAASDIKKTDIVKEKKTVVKTKVEEKQEVDEKQEIEEVTTKVEETSKIISPRRRPMTVEHSTIKENVNTKEDAKVEVVQTETKPIEQSKEDKMAAIKAKLAAIKAGR